MKRNVFISYRREDGSFLAHMLYTELKNRGINAFLDLETLKAGTFDTRLLQEIEECSDFVFVVSKNAFDRCGDPDDWVRSELRHAIKNRKNIIPVISVEHYDFPDNLPDDIKDIARFNGVLISDPSLLDAKMSKLISMMTFSKEEPKERQLSAFEQKRKKKLSLYLDSAKLWIVNFFYHFSIFICFGLNGERNAVPIATVFGIVALVMLIQQTKLVRKHVCGTVFWSVMFVLFVSFFYGFYTLVLMVASIFRRKVWKNEFATLGGK